MNLSYPVISMAVRKYNWSSRKRPTSTVPIIISVLKPRPHSRQYYCVGIISSSGRFEGVLGHNLTILHGVERPASASVGAQIVWPGILSLWATVNEVSRASHSPSIQSTAQLIKSISASNHANQTFISCKVSYPWSLNRVHHKEKHQYWLQLISCNVDQARIADYFGWSRWSYRPLFKKNIMTW